MANHISFSEFQSTLPLRGATDYCGGRLCVGGYFNPRSPCGERRQLLGQQLYAGYFNPRSPCGERPEHQLQHDREEVYFNPRSPCGERRRRRKPCSAVIDFNPRSPCGERRASPRPTVTRMLFQSTLPLRGATFVKKGRAQQCKISIHAPLAGSDRRRTVKRTVEYRFQSTLPLRGATAKCHNKARDKMCILRIWGGNYILLFTKFRGGVSDPSHIRHKNRCEASGYYV